MLGDTLALGLTLGEADAEPLMDGLTLADRLRLGEADALGDILGETDGLTDGEILGLTEAL